MQQSLERSLPENSEPVHYQPQYQSNQHHLQHPPLIPRSVIASDDDDDDTVDGLCGVANGPRCGFTVAAGAAGGGTGALFCDHQERLDIDDDDDDDDWPMSYTTSTTTRYHPDTSPPQTPFCLEFRRQGFRLSTYYTE